MAITVYRSDDANAPVLTAAPGAKAAVIKACLVSGYGSKAPAGWGVEFEDAPTNRTVFRAASGNRPCLYLDDSPVQYSVARGYLSMSSIDAGVGPFPSVAQLAAGIRPIKSYTATATERPWVLVAGTRAFYLWVFYAGTDIGAPTTSTDIWGFGEGISVLPGDTMMGFLIGRTSASTTDSAATLGTALGTGANGVGHYLASSYLQDGNSYPFGCLQSVQAGSAHMGAAGPAYPDPITGGLLLDVVRVCEGGTTAKLVRGRLPGLYNPLHALPGQHLDTLLGRGALSGHDMLLLYKGGGSAGRCAFSLNEADWLTPA